ncbi:hypothetical protein RJ45_01285 [Photobacterium gaetbulicola]|uniref:OmpA-like domain-containing protein n=1 Tax=Photobacterium gaetbulicola TaxID=1295392 RepID=A0A0B9GKR6_9GAMM|nr:OmpA family protein [Photobacterium gaetbulicola]KHT65435.1 hypothetical protein RJ45_01285 [Photobacterium gaetbulicola]
MRNCKRYGLLLSLLVFGCAQSDKASMQSATEVDKFLAANYEQASVVVIERFGDVEQKERQVIITLKGDNSFAYNSSNVKTGGRVVLEQLSQTLKELPESKVFIGGHTDSIGSEEYNRILSTHRAEAVHAILVDNGVDESRLGLFGFGKDFPIANNDTEEGRQLNRRIELRITPKFEAFTQ